MAKKDSHSSRAMKPPNFNDPKLIHGIGPAVERRLHGISIYTFAELAALSPADIAALVAGLSGLTAERITNLDWIGQARKLVSKSTSGKAQQEVESPVDTVQVARFTAPAQAPLEHTHTAALSVEQQ